LRRERRSNGDAWQAELAKVEKHIRGLIGAIKVGMFHESMKAEMDALQARKSEHKSDEFSKWLEENAVSDHVN